MQDPTRRFRRSDPRSGQSMVEFALTGMLVLMLVVGIFEIGRALWSYTTVSFAARQAARYAIVHSDLGDTGADSSSIDNEVKNNAVGLDPDKLVITKAWTPDNNRGSQFTITVRYPVGFVGAPIFLTNTDSVTVGSTASYTILH